jgi:anti-sigma B factor antagonist
MELKTKQSNDVAILELDGRYDAYTAQLVEDWLAQGKKHVVIDMSKVNFIDNAALKSLTRSTEQIQSEQGSLHICNLSQPVQIIMELTQFQQKLDIFHTQVEAIEKVVYALVA